MRRRLTERPNNVAAENHDVPNNETMPSLTVTRPSPPPSLLQPLTQESVALRTSPTDDDDDSNDDDDDDDDDYDDYDYDSGEDHYFVTDCSLSFNYSDDDDDDVDDNDSTLWGESIVHDDEGCNEEEEVDVDEEEEEEEKEEEESVFGSNEVIDFDDVEAEEDVFGSIEVPELLPPVTHSPPPQLRRSSRLASMIAISVPPLQPVLRRSPRLALLTRVSYVGMC